MSGAFADRRLAGEPGVDERLLRYLQDVAESPLSLAVERDRRLAMSRYHGVQSRRRLAELGYVRAHRVSTGRRSGQGVLLELTPAGQEPLEAAGVSVDLTAVRLSCRRRYYASRLAEYARTTWADATVETSDGADPSGRSPDVTVRVPGRGGTSAVHSIAFEVVVADEADDLRTRLRGVEAFDAVFLCTETEAAANELTKEADRLMPAEVRRRATVAPVSRFLPSPIRAARSREGAVTTRAPGTAGRSRAGRRSRLDDVLLRQVLEAYTHLHDLDRLQESPLADLPAVRERINPLAPMAQAQALRRMLLDAARQAARHAAEVPSQSPLRAFLEGYSEGKRVAEIAGELGVSREWCSRSYRKRALRFAAEQFVRLM